MTAATYTSAKTVKPAKRARASTASPAAQDQPLFNGTPAYARIHERKSSRAPLIAGGIAVIATIALVAGTNRTARDAEPFTPTQAAPTSAPAVIAAATPVQAAPAATPGAQLIAPAPAPAVRQQARMAPRPAAAAPLDANTAGQDASATVASAPAPLTIPQAPAAPEAEATPAPDAAAPEAATPQGLAPTSSDAGQ